MTCDDPARGELDDGRLHAVTDSQVRNSVFTGVTNGVDLTFKTAFPKTAGDQDGIYAFQHGQVVVVQVIGFQAHDVYLDPLPQPAMGNGLGQ